MEERETMPEVVVSLRLCEVEHRELPEGAVGKVADRLIRQLGAYPDLWTFIYQLRLYVIGTNQGYLQVYLNSCNRPWLKETSPIDLCGSRGAPVQLTRISFKAEAFSERLVAIYLNTANYHGAAEGIVAILKDLAGMPLLNQTTVQEAIRRLNISLGVLNVRGIKVTFTSTA